MRQALIITGLLALAACSGSSDAKPSTTPATGSASSSAAPATASTERTDDQTTVASPSTDAAAEGSRYAEICAAAYDAGIGNAATQERDPWIEDCTKECELPANRQTCDDMGEQLGID